MAEADFIKGVHLASDELCGQARTEWLQRVVEAGNVVLTARGLDSIGYNCEFLQNFKATRAPVWAVTAICQEPGYLFADMLSIVQMNDMQFDIVSVNPASAEEAGGNTGSYHFCPDVEMP